MSEPLSDIEATISFLSDLQALQSEIEGVHKDATNPHFKSQYADRTSIINSLKPLLAKHNFVVTQVLVPPPAGSFTPGESVLALATTLFHTKTGKSIGDTAIVPLPKSDPQGYGSAMTYTSRYALVALFVLPLLDDDDGNAGSHGSQKGGAGTFNSGKPTPSSSSKTTVKKGTATSATPKATATTPAASTPATTTAASAAEAPKTSEPASNETSPSEPAKPTPPAATKPVTKSLWGKS